MKNQCSNELNIQCCLCYSFGLGTQSKGSIDSLILNLKKAQSNAAVQAVVAVADEEQLAKIINESKGVIDENSLRAWNSDDVLTVYDSLARAHESINKLALVPESF
ncbi:MAG: hypothetical protein MJ141_02360 [Clostridia bacterium]|nr:hypothetical protein [Clostridia bacterium]